MSLTHRSCGALAGLVTLSGLAHAQQQAYRPPPRQAPPPTQLAGSVHIVPLGLDDLPRGELSKVALTQPQPGALAALPSPTDITREQPAGATGSSPKNRVAATSTPTTMTGSLPGTYAFRVQNGAVAMKSTYLPCGGICAYVVPVRWERFDPNATGGAVLEITEAWLERKSCTLGVARKTTLRPKAITTVGNIGVLFAVRSETDVTLFFPPQTSIAAEAGSTQIMMEAGVLPHVTLPIKRGVEATALASILDRDLNAWTGASTPIAHVEAVTIGVDIVQLVDDPKPVATVRTKSLR